MLRRSLQVLIGVSTVLICLMLTSGLIKPANAIVAFPDTAPPPLPSPKSGFGTPSSSPQSVCCVYGYVIWDGQPVDGATVTIHHSNLVTTTQTRPTIGLAHPSYSVMLDDTIFGLQAGDLLTITATYQGQTSSVHYVVQESGQQVDVVIAHSSFDCTAVSAISAAECAALVALYDQLNGPGWTTNTHWVQATNPCTWAGVSCANGHVSQLLLASNQMLGVIPPTIGNLSQLTTVDLHANRITGSIPPELTTLSTLIALDLSQNQLSGPLPNPLGDLVNLQQLNLGANQLSGAIPFELAHLQQLISLDLGNNALVAVGDVLRDFLRTRDSNWETTQTVAPAGFQALAEAQNEFRLRWTPVTYPQPSSHYELSIADADTARFTVLVSALSTDSSGYRLANLDAQKNYTVRIRTYTPPHTGQINGVWSVASPLLPIQLVNKLPIIALAAGAHHTCAALRIGRVKCWGSNNDGQLGDSTSLSQRVPVTVVNLPGPVQMLTAGGQHTCAATFGQLQCWGDDYYGQLGDNRTNANVDRPQPVEVEGLNHDTIAIGAGVQHTCSVMVTGAVKCWGATDSVFTIPTAVTGLSSGAKKIATGVTHNCVVLENGGVKCWGNNNAGQLGNGTIGGDSPPADVVGFGANRKAVAVAAGEFHSCALTDSGSVLCWGDQGHGQLGNGVFDINNDAPTPVPVNDLNSGVTAITAGAYHTCALLADGNVKCWGENDQGQLGDGTKNAKATPTDIIGLAGGVTILAAGGQHTCAALAAGGAQCWGDNVDGQLGDGTTESRTTPGDVADFKLEPLPPPQKWTFLIYAVGDNNLDPMMGDYAGGLIQRLRHTTLPENVTVAVLYDGAGNHSTQRYSFQSSGIITTSLPEARMDVSDTLRDFVAWGMGTLPGEAYYLAILDHANGVVGIGFDDTTAGLGQSYLEPQEIRAALQQAKSTAQHKLSIIHFDGCSFGLFEDASIVHDLTDYVIASPNTGWGIFAYDEYSKLAGQTDNEARQLAQHVAATYANRVQQNTTSPIPYTISIFDMTYYTATQNALGKLGSSLVQYVGADSQRRVQLQAKRNQEMQKYDSGDYWITDEDHYVDVGSMASVLKQMDATTEMSSAADSVNTALKDFVVTDLHSSGTLLIPFTNAMVTQDLEHAHGLGIYYPSGQFAKPGAYRNYVENKIFPWLTTDWGWAQFLREALPEAPVSATDVTGGIPPIITQTQLYLPLVIR